MANFTAVTLYWPMLTKNKLKKLLK